MELITSGFNNFTCHDISDEILKVLNSINFEFRKNSSKLLKEILEYRFKQLNWKHNLEIDNTVKKKIQFYSNKVGIVYNFTNIGRSMIDLIKLQHLYNIGMINSAVFICFTQEKSNKVANNLTSYEKIINDIILFKKIINLPILIIGLK